LSVSAFFSCASKGVFFGENLKRTVDGTPQNPDKQPKGKLLAIIHLWIKE